LRRDPGRSNPPARAGRAALGETALRAFVKFNMIKTLAKQREILLTAGAGNVVEILPIRLVANTMNR
jgi:hypothetical protein